MKTKEEINSWVKQIQDSSPNKITSLNEQIFSPKSVDEMKAYYCNLMEKRIDYLKNIGFISEELADNIYIESCNTIFDLNNLQDIDNLYLKYMNSFTKNFCEKYRKIFLEKNKIDFHNIIQRINFLQNQISQVIIIDKETRFEIVPFANLKELKHFLEKCKQDMIKKLKEHKNEFEKKIIQEQIYPQSQITIIPEYKILLKDMDFIIEYIENQKITFANISWNFSYIEEILNLIDNYELAKAFDKIDELGIIDDKYALLKKEFIIGKNSVDFIDRLKVFVRSLE